MWHRSSVIMVVLAWRLLPANAQTPCVNGMAGPYPCSNVDLMAVLSVTQLGSVTNAADIWGWTTTVIPTNTATCYLSTDTNLDGLVRYTGAMNDPDPIPGNVGGVVPTATRPEQLP